MQEEILTTNQGCDKDQVIIAELRHQNEILRNILETLNCSAEAKEPRRYTFRTNVTDIDISIGNMMNIMMKWLIASIPVGIILAIVWLIIGGVISSMMM